MRKVFVVLVLIMLPFASVSAHQFSNNDGLGFLIHVEPNDRPVAGENSGIYVELQDVDDFFTSSELQRCTCFVEVVDEEKVIAKKDFLQDGKPLNVSYVFPHEGNYTLRVTVQKDTERLIDASEKEIFVRSKDEPWYHTPLGGVGTVILGVSGIISIFLLVKRKSDQ